MKILNVIQGSDEWLKARLGVATASNFSKIVTSTGVIAKPHTEHALDLAGETLLDEPEDSYKSADMERGNELEPLAREAYEEYNFCTVTEVGLMLSDCGDWGYSSDGLVGEEGLIEIKCPKAKNHAKYLAGGKCPTAYIAQVQGGLMISDRKWCDFVSYHPDFKEGQQLFVCRVFRDEDFIIKLETNIKITIAKRDEILKNINNK